MESGDNPDPDVERNVNSNSAVIESGENCEDQEDSRKNSMTSEEGTDDKAGNVGTFFRTRSQVNYRESSRRECADSDMSDNQLIGIDEEEDAELLREESDHGGDISDDEFDENAVEVHLDL